VEPYPRRRRRRPRTPPRTATTSPADATSPVAAHPAPPLHPVAGPLLTASSTAPSDAAPSSAHRRPSAPPVAGLELRPTFPPLLCRRTSRSRGPLRRQPAARPPPCATALPTSQSEGQIEGEIRERGGDGTRQRRSVR
jgi:hypothetical protein